MLKVQSNYTKYLSEVSSLISRINFETTKIEELKHEITGAELIVPVVGSFSAGKSTLINSFLGKNILATKITPETALATELRYSEDEYIEAVKEDGNCDKYTLDENDVIKERASEYMHLRLYLKSEKLKKIEPLILVDMPGFDSPVQLHNQAILNYLNLGVYFVVLTSVEDGGISKSMMRELENIVEYGKGFSFCLSKTNLRPFEQVQEVAKRMQEQLEDEFDFDTDIILVDDNGGENLNKILESIDPEELFCKLFSSRLKTLFFQTESSLNVHISTLKHSKEDAQEAMNELQESIDKIKKKKQSMLDELESRYSSQGVESIIDAVSTELRNHKESLIDLALSNKDAFSNELNDIVKNRLIYEIKNKMNSISTNIIDDFSLELKSISSNLEGFSLNTQWVEKMTEEVTSLVQSVQEGLGKLSEWSSGKKGQAYKAIATILGLTTAILTPVLEIVLIFLPEIFGVFQKQKARNDISNKFDAEIIPSLSTNIRTVLPNILNEQLNKLIETVSAKFEEQLKSKEEEIALAIGEKEKNINEVEEHIKTLEEVKHSLQKLTTQTLYNKGEI